MIEPSSVRFERTRRIRFSQCDLAGIVFFPQYFVMFNDLIEEWFNDSLGIDYTNLIGARRVGLPTVKVECEFKAVSRMGDDVLFSLALENLGRRSITLRLECRAGEEVRVQASMVLVTTDLNVHRSVAIPADVREAIVRFQGQA